MNKKIKMIELLNMIANGEEMPKEIKLDNEVFVYIGKWEQYVTKEEEIPLLRRICDYNYSGLNDEVEILEDNTEEIEEIQEISDEYFNMLSDEAKVKWLKSYIKEDRNKINELVKAVNKLRKENKNGRRKQR